MRLRPQPLVGDVWLSSQKDAMASAVRGSVQDHPRRPFLVITRLPVAVASLGADLFDLVFSISELTAFVLRVAIPTPLTLILPPIIYFTGLVVS